MYLLMKLVELTNENKMIQLEHPNFITSNELIDPGMESVACLHQKGVSIDIMCHLMEENTT